MDTTRLNELCTEKGVNIARFEQECGFAKCSVQKWKDHTPAYEKLKKAAEYFNVSIPYLMGDTDIRGDIILEEMLEEDRALMHDIVGMDANEKAMMRIFVKGIKNGQ